MNQVQSFNFGNVSVSFRDDGYLNATAIAAHFGKRVPDFIKTEQNQEYINALAEHISKTTKIVLDRNQLVIVKHGGNNRGTWLHPKLAIHFARWLNPKFAVWCDEQIEALLNKVSDGIKTVTAKTTADDRTGLRQAVAALVRRKGIDYSSAYSMIHQRFNVEAIEDIPAEQLPQAVAYVHALTLHTGLVGEVLDREPLPAPQPLLNGLDIERLAVTVYYGAWALEMLKEVALPLRQLGHPKAVTMHTLWNESLRFLRHNIQALQRILPALESDHAAHVRDSLDRLKSLNARFI